MPKDNTFAGHYTCAEDGGKQCMDGWTGKDCNEGEGFLGFLGRIYLVSGICVVKLHVT